MGMSNGQIAGGAMGAVVGIAAAVGAGLATGGIGALAVVQGALIGFSLGYTVGGVVDPPRSAKTAQPQAALDLASNTYERTQPVPIVYGYARVWGEIIFTGALRTVRNSGSGGGKKAGDSQPDQLSYRVTFAVGLSEGEIHGIDSHTVAAPGATGCLAASGYGRIWADDQDRTCFEGLYLTLYEGTATETDTLGRTGLAVPWRRTAHILGFDCPLGTTPALPQISAAIKGIKVGGQSVRTYTDEANKPLRAQLDYTTNKLYFTLSSTSTQTPRGLARTDRDGQNWAHTAPPTGFGGTNALRAWYFGMYDILVMQDGVAGNKFWFGSWGLSAGSSSWKSVTFNSKLDLAAHAWHVDDLNNHLYLLMNSGSLDTMFVARIDVLKHTLEVHDIGFPTIGYVQADSAPDAVYFDPEDDYLYVMFHTTTVMDFILYRAPWQKDSEAKTKSFTVSTGTAQTGSTDTITLAAGDTGLTNAYVNLYVYIKAGTGYGQYRFIIGNNQTTKVVSVGDDWDTPPDGTSQYAIIWFPTCDGLAHAGDYVWIYARRTSAGGSTGYPGALFYYDMVQDRGPNRVAVTGTTTMMEYQGASNWYAMQFSQPLSEMVLVIGKADSLSVPATVADELADDIDIQDYTSHHNGWVVYTMKYQQIDMSWYAATKAEWHYWEWLGSPAGAVYDLITNTRYGMGVPAERVDFQSFMALDGYSSEPVLASEATGVAYSVRYKIDVAISVARSAIEHLKELLSGCMAYMVFSNGKVAVRLDRAFLRLVQRVREEDVIDGSLQVQRASRTDRPNRLRVDFLNGADTEMWRHDVAEYNDEYDQNLYGEVREQTVQILSLTRATQAMRLARLMLLTGAHNLASVTFSIGHQASLLEISDRINLTHGVPGFEDKQFKVVDLAEAEAGYQVTAIEHNPDLYRNEQTSAQATDGSVGATKGAWEFVLPTARVAVLELDTQPSVRLLYSLWGGVISLTESCVWDEGIGFPVNVVASKQGINPATGAPDASLVPVYRGLIDSRSYFLGSSATAVDLTFTVDLYSALGQQGNTVVYPLLAVVESYDVSANRLREVVRATDLTLAVMTVERGVCGTTAIAHTKRAVTLASAYVRQDHDTWQQRASVPSSTAGVSASILWSATSSYTSVVSDLIAGGFAVAAFDKELPPTTPGSGPAQRPVPKIRGLLLGANSIFNTINIEIDTPGTAGQMAFALVFLRSTGIDYVAVALGLVSVFRSHAHDCHGVLDGTRGFTQSGAIRFDPPRSWAATTEFNASKTLAGIVHADWSFVQDAETLPDATPRYWVMITPVPSSHGRAPSGLASEFPTLDTVSLGLDPYITLDQLHSPVYDYDPREVGRSVKFHWATYGRSGQICSQGATDEPERDLVLKGSSANPNPPTELKLSTDVAVYTSWVASTSPTITAADGDLLLSWRESSRFTGYGHDTYGQSPPGYGGRSDSDFQGFTVTITNKTTSAVLRTVTLTGNIVDYLYPSAQNVADNGGAYATSLKFEVVQNAGSGASTPATFETV